MERGRPARGARPVNVVHPPHCPCEFCRGDEAAAAPLGVDDAFVDDFLEDIAAIADARGLSDPPTAPPLQTGVVFGGASDPYDDRSPRGDE